MTSTIPDLLDLDLSDLSEEEWLARLDALGEEHGFFERMGREHAALFIDAGKKLLVAFETMEAARSAPSSAPLGFDHVTRNGWSLLAPVLAGGDLVPRSGGLGHLRPADR
ncbi:hypothetical protein ruthe_02965 [Rubellimicrobium thermophilum DSM 16684]|uniref:Uncharacterized protein n=1 Tax=Rubellimicrobium thermophilum DSM 16684 TaxID=1123069 RepID=S9SAQ1_9RHOB|nr:hypothetical protein [Rubellimicrobium thermophilum]EPX83339.1 hypothetical protein ruthe_02965 [Rubellimicrobium thermophilum DSM 16684]